VSELIKLFADNKAATLNSIGLTLTIVGVLLLFRYGIAFQVHTGGHFVLVDDRRDPAQFKHERRCLWLSSFGLAFVVVGTVCQIIANWVQQ
jgi:hypothetical protein